MQFVDIDDEKLQSKIKNLQEENDVLRIRLDDLEGEKTEHEFLCNHAARWDNRDAYVFPDR